MWAITTQAQTTAQKIARLDSIVKVQSASIAALNNTQVMLFDFIGKQRQEIDSLKRISHKLTFESPLIADSIKNYIKIDLAELKARLQ